MLLAEQVAEQPSKHGRGKPQNSVQLLRLILALPPTRIARAIDSALGSDEMSHELRDIHQLRDAPPFGVTVVEGLLTAEAMLHEAMRYVPHCDEHRNVWSSHFTRIILDAASQVDSIWKATTKIEAPNTASDKLTIKHHYKRFGKLVEKQKVVFFGGESPCEIGPFKQWTAATPPPWWKAYNSLKHDRFTYQKEATLDHAVSAVGALLIAIIYSGTCDLALVSAKMLDTGGGYNVWADAKLLREVSFECRAILETKMFVHPLGIFGVKNCNLSNYWYGNSTRFSIWWALNADRFTVPSKT